MTQLRGFDVVRVARLDRGARAFRGTEGCERQPRVGDVGTIVRDYAPGDASAPVAVEMVDESGRTVWLADFARGELELVHAARAPAVRVWLLWASWLVGPASYGLAYVVYVVAPEMWYGTPDPGPDVLLAMVMVLTHAIAGTMTLALVLVRGRHWRRAEFWVLLSYWVCIAGWLLPGALSVAAGGSAFDPRIPWLCTRIALVAVVLVPVVGLGRLCMVWIGRRPRAVG